MTAQFDGLAFGILLRRFLFHDSLRDLNDFVDKFDIVLDVVLFDIERVDNGSESLVKEVERLILKFTVNRVHFCHLEIYNFNEVEHVWNVR